MAKISPFTAVGIPLPFVVLLPFFFFSASPYAGGESTTIGDLLRGHGLPVGLLPKAVYSFAHDPSSGLLEVRIGRLCYVRYGDGLSFFDREVRGNLSYGAIRGVEGWSQEELFLWLPVKGIVVSDPESGVILFDIGLARKRLPISSFEDPPDCLPGGEEGEAADDIELFGNGRKGFGQQR
ncbi:uncharacterized protein LOC122006360 [Zingiber officinale]|uniref:DUF538 family protein n=1 Tax=Zingiber officinale TaxID=94328 RepID=A0A8J5FKL8_ZINOF|nr:uncharacterized protein LOC122006360 [Zingiber officinale]KAG6490315.1 hypothetical protein ZIOFF_051604 [Zingiber officinale]